MQEFPGEKAGDFFLRDLPFFCCTWLFIKVPYFQENSPASKNSWLRVRHLMYVQFTSCSYGGINFLETENYFLHIYLLVYFWRKKFSFYPNIFTFGNRNKISHVHYPISTSLAIPSLDMGHLEISALASASAFEYQCSFYTI